MNSPSKHNISLGHADTLIRPKKKKKVWFRLVFFFFFFFSGSKGWVGNYSGLDIKGIVKPKNIKIETTVETKTPTSWMPLTKLKLLWKQRHLHLGCPWGKL